MVMLNNYYGILDVMNLNYYTIFLLCFLGLIAGSFALAQVWRLRRQQLEDDEKNGDKVSVKDKKAVEQLLHKGIRNDRSVCLHCGHQLQWYDLIPLVSWLQLKGKCRYCRNKIGHAEPLAEIGTALFFIISYIFWPTSLDSSIEILRFTLWLIAGVGMSILFIYDYKWFLLPDKVVFPLIALGVFNSFLVISANNFTFTSISSVVYACLILSGLYFLIYVISRYRWVGFGDVKLGLALALLLADWRLSLLTLFLANLIGTLIVVPLMLLGKIKRHTHVPFGPLLIVGWFLTGIFGTRIIGLYLNLLF